MGTKWQIVEEGGYRAVAHVDSYAAARAVISQYDAADELRALAERVVIRCDMLDPLLAKAARAALAKAAQP